MLNFFLSSSKVVHRLDGKHRMQRISTNDMGVDLTTGIKKWDPQIFIKFLYHGNAY